MLSAQRVGSKLRALGVALASSLVLGVLCAAGHAVSTTTLRPTCVVSGNTCTVRMAMSAADDNVNVVITTPRPNHGADITDNNHKPFTAMYNVDENSRGITFQLQGTTSLAPGTVLIIIFKLAPIGSTPASTTPASTSTPTTSGTAALSLSGPSSNKLGSAFSYKVSGNPSAAAEFVAVEVTGSACAASASAYSASSERVHQTVPAGAFDVTFHLTAEPAGTFALCVYLLNPATHATEAHAGAHWTNAG